MRYRVADDPLAVLKLRPMKLGNVVAAANARADSCIERGWLNVDGAWGDGTTTAPCELNSGDLAVDDHIVIRRAPVNDGDDIFKKITTTINP